MWGLSMMSQKEAFRKPGFLGNWSSRLRASPGLPRGFLGVFLELLFLTSLTVLAVDLLFLLLFLSLLARLRIPLMEEDLGCTFFNFIDFVVVTVQVNFIQKVFFIYHLTREFELKFYMKPMLCRIICQFYSMFEMLNKIDFLKIINL